MSKKVLIAVGASLAGLLAFGVLFSAILGDSFSQTEKLKLASQWLDNGRWDLAGRLAQELEPKVDKESDALWCYVKGVALLMRVYDDLDSYENRLVLYEATGHLEKSRQIGFPLGYRGKGNYYLGVCLFNTYRWNEAIERLSESLADYPQVRSDSLRMIVICHLRKPNADTRAAEQTLEQWLSMPGLSARELARTHIARAQLALRQSAPQDCQPWLSKIPSGIPEYFEGAKWQSLALIQESLQYPASSPRRQEHLEQAQNTLQRLIVAADTPYHIRRQAFYLSGRVLRYQGRLREAVSTLSGVRQHNPFSAEAIAACLEEAEILLELERLQDVLTTTRHLLRGISDIRLYNEFWISSDELRGRLIDLGNALRTKEKYDLALQLADQLHLAFPPSHSLRLQANTLANWASDLEQEAATGSPNAQAEFADMYARAGERYEQLAELEIRSREYLNIVWSAAENYQKANRLNAANRMLLTYLKYEDRNKRPRALLALGRNLLAVGDWSASLEPLQRCLIEHTTNPTSYEARLLSARALAELNDLDQAIELLSSNLWDYDLNPESPIWQDSFIQLGNLIFQRAQRWQRTASEELGGSWSDVGPRLEAGHREFIQGIDRLSEAARRYPHDPRYNQTRYLLARSYQLAAEFPQQATTLNPSLSDVAKRQLRQQRTALLENAVTEYGQLHRSITAQRESVALGSLDFSLLRNACFGEADMLKALGRHEEAAGAYLTAASHFSNQPEALEALVQVAECYRKLGRDAEAKKVVRQAELVLQRIPNELDGAFVAHTRGDRRHWQQLLGWLREWH